MHDTFLKPGLDAFLYAVPVLTRFFVGGVSRFQFSGKSAIRGPRQAFRNHQLNPRFAKRPDNSLQTNVFHEIPQDSQRGRKTGGNPLKKLLTCAVNGVYIHESHPYRADCLLRVSVPVDSFPHLTCELALFVDARPVCFYSWRKRKCRVPALPGLQSESPIRHRPVPKCAKLRQSFLNLNRRIVRLRDEPNIWGSPRLNGSP